MGSPEFAVPSLEALHRTPHEIIRVVSLPDKRRSRRGKPIPTDVKKKALELGLPVMEAEDLRSEAFSGEIEALKPDLIVVVAFRILPAPVLDIPAFGAINLHASLLPKYRGAAPIHHAVMNGENETGCTVFFLNERVDTGEIIAAVKTDIGKDETTGDLYNRLKDAGAGLLASCVNEIAMGRAESHSQKDEEATPAPKLIKENTRIDFSQSAEEVHNRVRGLNPFPVAWALRGEEQVKIYRTRPVSLCNLLPGVLKREGDKLLAGCGAGCVELLELQLPGTKVMSGTEFANGYDVNVPLE
ncbi:MAG: methionyl-tRNA formyltransferase [Balneolaceae bacterium]|nr:MAG: methionyl-tRNA formyltransferase [Balneolaceae bacterium]